MVRRSHERRECLAKAEAPRLIKSPPQRAVSRILSAFVRHSASFAGCASADCGGTIIPLGPALLAGSSDLPGGFGRAVLKRLPIWPCSVRGFACHPPYSGRGALLPHLFTLTRLRPCGLRRGKPCDLPLAVYFLCHCPSSCPDRALSGALPSGVRTFLAPSPPCHREAASATQARDRLAHCGGTMIIRQFPV